MWSLYTGLTVNKSLWKHVSYILTDHLNRVRIKLKNFMKSNEIALNSKHGTENIKNKNQGNRKTKSQKDKNLVLAKE